MNKPNWAEKATFITLLLTVFVIFWYTFETYQLRQIAEERKVVELRGYFGALKDFSLNDFNNKELSFRFKNFGKTPLFKINRKFMLIDRDSGEIVKQKEFKTKGNILNPGGEMNDFLYSDLDNFFYDNLDKYDLILEHYYENIYKQKEKHVLHLRFESEFIMVVGESVFEL